MTNKKVTSMAYEDSVKLSDITGVIFAASGNKSSFAS
jgi:hypothetical protein